MLNEFVQYTVNEGIIEDTLEQRAAMTKAGYRAMFTIVVTCGNEAGLYTAANLLDHSLQDVPGNFVKGSSTGYAIQIVQSDEMQSIIEDFKDYVSGKNLSARTISGSIALDSTLDLYLAYNLVDYVISGTNSNGEWDLTIRITDEYDFDPVAWEDGVAEYSDAVGILVDHAVDAQAVGAIVPYNIMITGKTSFTE